MWTDHINGNVVPFAKRLIAQSQGTTKEVLDIKGLSMALGDLRNSVATIEQHLRLRNFLVGHSLTLADVLLVAVMAMSSAKPLAT